MTKYYIYERSAGVFTVSDVPEDGFLADFDTESKKMDEIFRLADQVLATMGVIDGETSVSFSCR